MEENARLKAEVERLRGVLGEWHRANEALVVALNAQGEGRIPRGSPADLATNRWDKADESLKQVAAEVAGGE
jgi:hypothetical protein